MDDNSHHDDAGTSRELFRIALPLVLSSGSLSLNVFIDRVYLSWYSLDALAAALPAAALHWTVVCLFMFTGQYVNAFVAQYSGAGERDRVAAAVWQGVYWTLISAPLMWIFVPLAPLIFSYSGHAPEVQRLEVTYFSFLISGAGFAVLDSVLSSFFSGRGKTKVVLFVNLMIVAVNLVLAYILIFGVGPVPSFGIAGAAVATVTANIVGACIYVTLIFRPKVANEFQVWKNRHFDRELFWRLIRYGFPSGVQYTIDVGAFSAFVFLVGQLGKYQLAASNMAFNINALAFIPMMGFGTAVMTLVGQRIGEGRPELAVRTTWKAFAIAGTYLLTFGSVVVFAPGLMMSPFAMEIDPAEFAQLEPYVIVLLRFVAAFTFFDGMAVIFGFAVRGAGDTRFSLLWTFATNWFLMVVPTVIYWKFVGGSLMFGWSACTLYVVVLGIGFVWRFQAGQWMSMSIIEKSAKSDESKSLRASDEDVEDAPMPVETV